MIHKSTELTVSLTIFSNPKSKFCQNYLTSFFAQVCEDNPVQKCETVTMLMEYQVPVEKCEEEEEEEESSSSFFDIFGKKRSFE